LSAQGVGAPQLLADRYMLTQTVRKGAQATVTQAFDSKLGKRRRWLNMVNMTTHFQQDSGT
jgi:hypothetical protein